jgi:hypothetical protein
MADNKNDESKKQGQGSTGYSNDQGQYSGGQKGGQSSNTNDNGEMNNTDMDDTNM